MTQAFPSHKNAEQQKYARPGNARYAAAGNLKLKGLLLEKPPIWKGAHHFGGVFQCMQLKTGGPSESLIVVLVSASIMPGNNSAC